MRKGVLLCAVAGVVIALVPAPGAGAFPREGAPHTMCGSVVDGQLTLTYRFTGTGWTPSRKAIVGPAVEQWEATADWDGGKAIDIQETLETTQDIKIKWVAAPGGEPSALGYGNCEDENPDYPTLRVLELNTTLQSESSELMTQVARHEMGHVFGLRHTGHYDDFTYGWAIQPATIATMFVCYIDLAEAATAFYGQDDAGQLLHRLDGLSPKPIHPNGSFENATRLEYWGKTGGTWSAVGSGSADGVWHIRWKADNNNQYLYLTQNLSIGGDIYAQFGPGVADARANVKKYSSTDIGGVALEMWVQHREYPGSTPNCYWPTGLDQNTTTLSGVWFLAATTYFVGTPQDWNYTNFTTPSYQFPSSFDAADIQIRVRSSALTSSLQRAYVRIDNTRARDRS